LTTWQSALNTYERNTKMFTEDITLTKDALNEFQQKIAELLKFTEENKIPLALTWGMLSFGFSKAAFHA